MPRDRAHLPVIGLIRSAMGAHSLFAMLVDSEGRPLSELCRSSFLVALPEGSSADLSLDEAFAPWPGSSGAEAAAARLWYLQRPWQLQV